MDENCERLNPVKYGNKSEAKELRLSEVVRKDTIIVRPVEHYKLSLSSRCSSSIY